MINLCDMTNEDLLILELQTKKKIVQLHNAQMAIKIAMNSLYGATANIYFLYYIGEMAEAITMSGQLSVRYAEKAVNAYMNKIMKTQDIDYIHYIDTDSIYLGMGPLVKKVFGPDDISVSQGEEFLDSVCKTKIEVVLSDAYKELSNYMGSYENAMRMKREKITNRSLFVAKKRYIMNVLNSEGVHYDIPKISITGIEAVRSTTPEVCRKKMKETFKVIMNSTEKEVQSFVDDFKDTFKSLPVEEISKISGTNSIEEYMDGNGYCKACPIHVRGCILYNRMLKKQELDKKYDIIMSGDKIKYVYLKMPNPSGENVISYANVLPPEFGLHNYIDHDLQFEKLFVAPVNKILTAIGWSAKKIDTIESFFS